MFSSINAAAPIGDTLLLLFETTIWQAHPTLTFEWPCVAVSPFQIFNNSSNNLPALGTILTVKTGSNTRNTCRGTIQKSESPPPFVGYIYIPTIYICSMSSWRQTLLFFKIKSPSWPQSRVTWSFLKSSLTSNRLASGCFQISRKGNGWPLWAHSLYIHEILGWTSAFRVGG